MCPVKLSKRRGTDIYSLRESCVQEIFSHINRIFTQLSKYNTDDDRFNLDDLKGGIKVFVTRAERDIERGSTIPHIPTKPQQQSENIDRDLLPPGFDSMPDCVKRSVIASLKQQTFMRPKPTKKNTTKPQNPNMLSNVEVTEFAACTKRIAGLIEQKFPDVSITAEAQGALQNAVTASLRNFIKSSTYKECKEEEKKTETNTISALPVKAKTVMQMGMVKFNGAPEPKAAPSGSISVELMKEIAAACTKQEVDTKSFIKDFCAVEMNLVSNAVNAIIEPKDDLTSEQAFAKYCAAAGIGAFAYASKFVDTFADSKKTKKQAEFCRKMLGVMKKHVDGLADMARFEPSVLENVLKDARTKERTFIEETVCRKIKKTAEQIHELTAPFLGLLQTVEQTLAAKCDLVTFVSQVLDLLPYVETLIRFTKTLLDYTKTLQEVKDINVTDSAKEETDDKLGANVNIWKEERKPVVEGAEKYLKSGTINHVVTAMTGCEEDPRVKMTEVSSNFSFITTYRSICTPFELLQKIIERYQVPANTDRKQAMMIRSKVIILVRYWIDKKYRDFDFNVIKEFQTWISTLQDPTRKTLAKLLSTRIVDLKDQLSIDQLDWSLDIKPQSLETVLASISAEDLAASLSVIDMKLFQNVIASDLFSMNWAKDDKAYKSPSISDIASRSTDITRFVQWSILTQPCVLTRSAIMTKFIKVAQCLYKHSNFQTMMSVVFALLSPPISRLEVTAEHIKRQYKEELEEMATITNPTGSFKAYREKFAERQNNQEFIPYLGVYLSDLTFMQDGNPDFVDAPDGGSKYIYYDKVELMDKVMVEIEKVQKAHDSFLGQISKNLPQFVKLISQLPTFDDENIFYDMSKALEPKGCKKEDIL